MPYTIPPEKKVRMLALLALAWDGQWFLKVCDEVRLGDGGTAERTGAGRLRAHRNADDVTCAGQANRR